VYRQMVLKLAAPIRPGEEKSRRGKDEEKKKRPATVVGILRTATYRDIYQRVGQKKKR